MSPSTTGYALSVVVSVLLVGCSCRHTNDVSSFRVVLPSSSHSASAQVVDTFSENLDEFTLCYWLRPTNWTGRGPSRAVFSYSAANSPNDVLVTIHRENVTLFRRGRSVSLQLRNGTLQSGKWHHICTTWSAFQGTVHLFADGVFASTGRLSPSIPAVPLGGLVILGSSHATNDVSGNDCHQCEPWRGDIAEVHVWDNVLCENEILDISTCNSTMEGNILSWSRVTIIPEKGAAVKSVHLCEVTDCSESDLD